MEEIGLTVTQLVELYLPIGFSVSEDYVKKITKLHQLMYYKAAEIDETDKYDITKWPEEWQMLLGYLVTHSLLKRILTGAFISGSGGEDGTSENAGGSGIKKITTGPTEVEYHNSAESLANIIKNLKDGVFIEGLLSDACPLANRLGVKVPFCAGNSFGTRLGQIKPDCGCHSIMDNIVIGCEKNKPASMG